MSRSWLAEFLLILNKELTCCLRDSDVLIYGVFFPLLLYPFAIVVSTEVMTWQKGMNELHKAKVAVVDSDPKRSQALRAALSANPRLELHKYTEASAAEQALQQGSIDGLIVPAADSHDIEIRTNNSDEFLVKASETIEQAISEARKEALSAALSQKEMPREYLEPYHTVVQSLQGTKLKASAVPFPKDLLSTLFLAINCTLAIQALLVGGSAATCLLALEREKKTLATTLLLPVKRSQIMVAKFASVIVASCASGVINAAGFFMTLAVMTLAMLLSSKSTSLLWILKNGLLPQPIHIAYVLGALFAIHKVMPGVLLSMFGLPTLTNLILIPFVQLGSMALATASYFALAAGCKSYKEAQVMLTMPMSICVFLPFLCCLPGVELSASTALIPLANLFFLLKPGTPSAGIIAIIFAVNAVLTLILLRLATFTFMREDGQESPLMRIFTGERVKLQ